MRTKKKNNKIVMVDERKKEQKGFSKKKKKARTAQDTIPFDEVYENGLFRMDETFSILFMYDNIDYKVMRDDEKTAFYEKYMHFLNTLPQDVQYQELILNYPTNREMLESAMIPKQEMTMLQNSEFLVLLAQKEDDLEILQKMFRLSDNQAKYLDIDESGKGLIKCGKRIIPFSNLLPTDSLMYKICTTKFKDIQAQIKRTT